MTSRGIVRKSKFRHVYAEKPKLESAWSGFRLTKENWDQDFIAVNPLWMAIPLSSGGGSGIGILNTRAPGRLADIPMLAAHRGAVMNLSWNPFHDGILCSSSADCTLKIWSVTEDISGVVEDPVQELLGHSRKVGTCSWNTVAENLLATSGADYAVKVWDVTTGDAVIDILGEHGGLITSTNWNYDGSLLVTACKDKHLRLIDPRAGSVIADVDRSNVQGPKGNRALFLGKHDKIISVGFGRNQRQYSVYDVNDMSAPFIKPVRLDSNAGGLIPHYDMDTEMLYVGGKGDSTINYYEIDVTSTDPKKFVFHIDSYSSNEPQKGLGFMPKRGCDVNVNEVAKLFKVCQTKVEPLSFRVPRKSQGSFADDLFPPCSGPDAALSSEQWLGGENAAPLTIDLSQGYVAVEKEEVVFEKVEVEDEPKNLKEYKAAYRELKDRVSYLEAELAKNGISV